MTMGLRKRMLLLALLPATLVATLLTATFLTHAIDDLEQGLHTRGSAISRQLAGAAEYDVFSGRRDSLTALTASAQRFDPEVISAIIIDTQDTIMARSGNPTMTDWPLLVKTKVHHHAAGSLVFVEPITRSSVQVDDIYGGGNDVRAASQPVLGYAVVEMTLQGISRRSRWLTVIGVLVALLGSALGGWLALRIARTVTRPLLEAGEVVARIGAGETAARMAAESAGSLRALASGINDMAGRIGMSQEELRARVAETTRELQREKDAAERATNDKSHFIAAASHDLRQPLHALGLFVSRLARSKVADKESLLVAHIQESVDSLRNLLDAILDVSQLDHGNVIPEIGNFPLASVLDQLDRNFAPSAEHRGLKLKLRPTRMWVRSDPNLVGRILVNLVSNALRYTRAGGILVGFRRRGDGVRIEVWDTGEGIPSEVQEKIFEDYVQLGNSERNRAKGLGLGLAICRRLAILLAVPIGVRSRPGLGSMFWIELPVAPPGAVSRPLADESTQIELAVESSRLSGTVLVVDGDTLIRTGMEQAIRGWGGDVLLAATQKEALHLCHESDHAPDLAICNVRLPDRVSGIQLGKELQREFEHMEILLVSADDNAEVQEAARRAGFALLRQPVPPGRLRAVLQQLLTPG